jgi:Zn-dependent protease
MLDLLLNPTTVLILSLLVAITVHEFAHALAADKLGDPTPRLQGRLTLNPIAHLDPFGTFLPLFLILMGSRFIFGWGKPVQFDPFNLENPRRDAAIISLAGPLSNITLASLLSIVLRFSIIPFSPLAPLINLIPSLIIINVILAVFNLIPIHPLDGGKILVGLLPPKEAREVDIFMQRYGMFLLLLVIFPVFGGVSLAGRFISPIINFLLNIYLPVNLI